MTTPSTADDAYLQPAVAAEFASLAGLLAAASDAQWDTPSMCEGWRVREVVAHVTMAARYSEEEFMAELRRCEFDFTRLSDEVASRDASLPVDELVANLRSSVMQRWTPPGGGYHGALNHVVIHGLDVTAPLGASRCSPTRPSGSSSMTSRRAAATPASGSLSTAVTSRPATSTVTRLGPSPARRGRRPGARAVRPRGPRRTAQGRPATARLRSKYRTWTRSRRGTARRSRTRSMTRDRP